MNKVSKKVILENVRCSYVYVDKTNKHDKYGVQPLLEKGSVAHKKAKKAHDQVLVEAFGEKALKQPGKFKFALRDADEEGKEEDYYENMIFFNAGNISKPGVVNRQGEPADQDDIDEYCYSGAYFHVSITFKSFPPIEGGKPGVGAYVNNVMLRKKGDRIDGSIAATSEFEDFAEEDDEIDFDDDL